MKIYPTKKLGEACEVVGGGTPKTNISKYWDGDIVWVTPKDLGKLKTSKILTSFKRISNIGLQESSASLLPRGTIVLSSRAPIGYVAIADVPLATNQGCKSFICNEEKIYHKYLYYFLIHSREYLNSIGGGSTFKEVSGSTLKNVEIPLPPLAEQKKIVARLEKLLAKVKEAKRLRVEARDATKTLLSANLHKIFEEGKKQGWEEKDLGDIVEIKHGYAFKGEYFNKIRGSILLTPGNFLETGGLYFTNKNTKKYSGLIGSEFVLKKGDLVVVMTDLSSKCKILGNPAFVDREGVLHNQRIGKIVPKNDQISREFLYHFFLSESYKRCVKDTATGTTVRHTAPRRIYQVKIQFPPLTEQKKIVARLDALSAKLKKIEEYQQSAQVDLDRLEQSILHQAFSGE